MYILLLKHSKKPAFPIASKDVILLLLQMNAIQTDILKKITGK